MSSVKSTLSSADASAGRFSASDSGCVLAQHVVYDHAGQRHFDDQIGKQRQMLVAHPAEQIDRRPGKADEQKCSPRR